ncbi:MAG: LIC_10190 family membrane protein [Dysgonomonas sp.]
MLAIFISWIVISFTLFSLGDIFINLYNKFCKSNENYNFLDTFLLGLCFVTLLVSLTSIWFPSNEFILLAFVIISVIYWIGNRKRLNTIIRHYKKNITPLLGISIGIIILCIAFFISFLSDSFDAEYYHHQNIRWNEEYPVVPGLANIEDRFGFNSSYLLVSAVFSFRFLFGEGIYSLQSSLYILLICWIMYSLVKSKFDIKYIIATVFLIIIFLIADTLLDNSSTDIIPILCIFYYILKTVISPNWIIRQPLLAYLLPVALITFKLSSAIFCLTSIGILIYFVMRRKNRQLIFCLTTSLVLILFWSIRNVIITGYLVYPIHEIDLFSFDWKMPTATLLLQKAHIHEWAFLMFYKNFNHYIFLDELNTYKILAIIKLTSWIAFALSILSPITIIYSIAKKKDIHIFIYILYFITILCLVFNMISAPDFRFLYGYIYGCAYIHVYLILRNLKSPSLRIGNIILITTVFIFCFINFKKMSLLISYIYTHDKTQLISAIIKPIPHPRSTEANREFEKHKIGNIPVYITKKPNGRTFDILPATNPTGIPLTPFDGNKIQSIETIESRGNKIQDGFRTKPKYTDALNNNIEEYKKNYLKLFNEKYYKK